LDTDRAEAPLCLGLFGGKIDYNRPEPFCCWAFQRDAGGDFVEGDRRAWARSLVPALTSA